jgi:hypothetical protein
MERLSRSDSFVAEVGSGLSRIQVWIGGTVANVAAASFVPDSSNDGIPQSLPVVWNKPRTYQ